MLQARDYTGQVTLATVTLILKDNKLYALYTAINITLHYTTFRLQGMYHHRLSLLVAFRKS